MNCQFSLFLHASHLHQWSDTAIACCFTCQWCIPLKHILSNAHSNSTNSRTTFLTSKKHLVSIQNGLRKFQLIYGSEVGGGGNEVTRNCHSICQKQLGDRCYLLKTGWVPVTCCWATNISFLEAMEIQALCSTLYNHPPCKVIPRACCFAQREVAVERKVVASTFVSNPTELSKKVNTVTMPSHGWKKRVCLCLNYVTVLEHCLCLNICWCWLSLPSSCHIKVRQIWPQNKSVLAVYF